MFLTQKEFGQRLRELRCAAAMTQEAVGAALNYSRSTYSYMEEGSVSLKADVIQRLAAVFRVPVSAFFTLEETEYKNRRRTRNHPSPSAEKIGDLSREEKTLIAVLRVRQETEPELVKQLIETAQGKES